MEPEPMPERCYWNPGSCSCSWRMNSINTQATSKIFTSGKQISPRPAGRGEKSTHSLLSYRGFYPLKMGGVPTWGPERCVFLPLALLNYLCQSLSNRSFRGWKCPLNLMVSFPFSSNKLRGLGNNVHLGIGTHPIVNKACGDVTPWSP